MRDVTYVLVFM